MAAAAAMAMSQVLFMGALRWSKKKASATIADKPLNRAEHR
jgi:hypothetical protein